MMFESESELADAVVCVGSPAPITLLAADFMMDVLETGMLICADGLQLRVGIRAGIWAEVRRPTRMDKDYFFFCQFVFWSVWVGPLTLWVIRVKSSGSWFDPYKSLIIVF
jgi:hypothetical protein